MFDPAPSPTPSSTIPIYLTTFIGRNADLQAIISQLGAPEARLMTITGPAGVGKTRLMVEAVRNWMVIGPRLQDEVVFIDGASIERAADLLPVIATVLNVEQAGRPSGEAISEYLAGRDTLLLLDNFEHLASETPAIAAMLRACPGLRVLATSRMPLRLSGERLLALEPLDLMPGEPDGWSPAALLFLDRARMADRTIARDTVDRAVVDTIVTRVDGIPLAIELAAARLRILSAEALAALLTRQLTVLTDGPSDVAARHRTLARAIDWSYQLLSPERGHLMRCLGIFPESFSLDAVESVCLLQVEPLRRRGEALAGVSELFDQGLVQRVSGDHSASPRFRMLTSIREFARDRLLEADEYREIAARFSGHFVRLAESEAERLHEPEPSEALAAIARDMANLRQVFTLSIELDDPAPALRAIAALWRFWEVRGPLHEARQSIEDLFTRFEIENDPLWGAALRGGGVVAELQYAWDDARRWHQHAIDVWSAIGDRVNLGRSVLDLANVFSSTGDFTRASELYAQAAAICHDSGEHRGELIARCMIATMALRQGRLEESVRQHQELEIAVRRLGEPVALATFLSNLGVALARLGVSETGLERLQESLRIRREMGDDYGVAASLINIEEARGRTAFGGPNAQEALEIGIRLSAPDLIGEASAHMAMGAIQRRDPTAAARWLDDALRLYAGNSPIYSSEIIGIAAELVASSEPEDAAQLLGAAHRLRTDLGTPWVGHHGDRIRATQDRLCGVLGDERYQELAASGERMDQSQAILAALTVVRRTGARASEPIATNRSDLGLTPRELVVLRLVAAGRTDREIAGELFISRKTASHHVTSILAKLDCRNRAGATALAVRMGITDPS